MENKNIFRKKSLDRANMPDRLDDYIKLSNPGVWLVLAAIGVLLLGVAAWSLFGNLTSSVYAVAFVQDGRAIILVDPGDVDRVEAVKAERTGDETQARRVSMDGADFYVTEFGSPEQTRENMGAFRPSDSVVRLTAQTDAPDGFYAGDLVVESTRPITLLFN